jgi:uncharacterized cupin superfamily protein
MPARITRAGTAPPYSPPLHEGVLAWRLQGHEAGPSRAFWVGRSLYPPGSSASLSPTAEETVYVVLGGELTLVTEDGTSLLRAGDSVHMTRGTARSLANHGEEDAAIIVIIASPREASA